MAEGVEPESSRITWGRLWIGEMNFGYAENLILKLSYRQSPLLTFLLFSFSFCMLGDFRL